MLKMKSFLIFLYLFLFKITVATNFVHLIGYKILAEPLQSFQYLTEDECANECVSFSASDASDSECIGFDYSNINFECILLTNVRNIITNITACNFYIYDRINDVNITDNQLSATDKLVFSNAYFNSSCPQGSTDDLFECSIVITEEKCQEYANFFNASYDGNKCIFAKANQSQWYCVPTSSPDNWEYFREDEGNCYFKITSSPAQNMSTFIQDCQAVSANSFPVSICSAEENDWFLGIIDNTITMIGLYNPIDKAYTWSNGTYVWADGRDCQYRKWDTPEPDNYYNDTETITEILPSGYWRDIPYTSTSQNLYCKRNALTLEEYANSCNTLDNCEQVKRS